MIGGRTFGQQIKGDRIGDMGGSRLSENSAQFKSNMFDFSCDVGKPCKDW